jgi:lysophospholipase L1-like esterase
MRLCWGTGAALALAGLVGLGVVVGPSASVGATTGADASVVGSISALVPYYLALGGSGSVGEQPTTLHPRGAPTEDGYANDLAQDLQARWPGLALARLGCPGATTFTVLDGGGRCAYAEGSQLSSALSFLHQHHTVLVTIDLGFNDLRPCLASEVINQVCVRQALDQVHDQLSLILTALKAGVDPGTQIIGLDHYDPYVGRSFRSPADSAFIEGSVAVVGELNRMLKATYGAAGLPMADVSGVFDTADQEPTSFDGHTVTRQVARVCALTWMCAPAPMGPNQHPNDAGYEAISRSILSLVR